jgi:hypothetical protein
MEIPLKTNLVLPLLLSCLAMAQSAGTFTATGSMNTSRARHTATLLPTSKVLIAGGTSAGLLNDEPVSSAELYDPSTGAFTPTGNMITARAGHAAVLLANGKVLIIGGSSGAYAELYDPSTGTFTATAQILPGHATLLRDGRVLISGYPVAELYDPNTGTSTAAAAYAAGGDSADPATLLADGRVLISSGGAGQLYDPGTGVFSLAGAGSVPDSDYPTATLLTNGRVLFVGGDSFGDPVDAIVYDPSVGTFKNIGNTTAGHSFSAAALLPDGTVFVAGGQVPGGNGTAATDFFVPASDTFYSGDMITPAMSTRLHCSPTARC